ncbi:MAG TPA: exodeoxyribonuclease VII small subunit [Firmicutes bacterium]|nr:exodeoxyribonuclease VII small subunit [Bacillota bacterium]
MVKEDSFAAALTRLEQVVQVLEGGELGLEEALALFEEGVGLIRLCNEKLEKAEGKIKLLLQENNSIKLEPWGEGEKP